MSRIFLALLLVGVLISAGCGYSSHNYMGGNGGPHITQIMPNSATAGGTAFSLTVEGTGFGADSVVYWGTTPQTTSYTSTTHVEADISSAEIANMGSVQVYVRSGGANSNAVTFTIQ